MLTDTAIKKAKPQEKPFKLSDSGGLHLIVKPAGGKQWCVKYRFGGKEKLLSIGTYPEISLADARTALDGAKRLLQLGHDPGVEKKLKTLEPEGCLVADLRGDVR